MTRTDVSSAVCFSSERFDYRSELPPEANAGNRFYGKDVAAFLAQQLSTAGLAEDYLDEDWGWLVFSSRGAALEFDIAVYNLAEHGEGVRAGVGEWGLWIHAYERRKLFGLLTTRREVAVPQRLAAAIDDAIVAAGAAPRPWQDAP